MITGRSSGVVLACVCLVMLAGCKVGSDYRRPEAVAAGPMPARFSEDSTNRAAEWKTAEPSAHLPRDQWWSIFGDTELNRLETLVAEGNLELAVAAARLEQARALVDVARSGWYPDLTAEPRYTRQRTSSNQPQNGRAAGASYTYDTWTVALASGWEVDLWGRVRREVEAGRARLTASSDDAEALKLQLQAEVATDYFSYRSTEAEQDLLRRTVEAYQHSLELTRNRRAGGIATDLDVAQAESQLKTAEAQLPEIALRRVRLRNALATLCGKPAPDFSVAETQAQVADAAIPAVPVSLPSELLERRPDIAAAERRMAGVNADVGVARAAFYPRVRLNGLAGFQSVDAGTLFDWPSRLWAVGPSIEWPLFTGGRNRAQLASARAAYDETVARYRQTVLVGFQEVEDQIAAQRLLAEQLAAETVAMNAARRTVEISTNRYRAGLVTYLEVAVAQSAELARERSVVVLQAERRAAAVALIKVLGGGWESKAR